MSLHKASAYLICIQTGDIYIRQNNPDNFVIIDLYLACVCHVMVICSIIMRVIWKAS